MTALRPPRYLRPMNKVMMAVQRLGIPTGPAMVLTVPGRKSGQPRSTPMTPFEFPAKVPVGVGFAKRSGLVRDGTADEFEALAGQLAVFRFDPA